MRIYQEEAGVISSDKVWICICEGYIYIAETLELLIVVLNTEWKQDQHLAG